MWLASPRGQQGGAGARFRGRGGAWPQGGGGAWLLAANRRGRGRGLPARGRRGRHHVRWQHGGGGRQEGQGQGGGGGTAAAAGGGEGWDGTGRDGSGRVGLGARRGCSGGIAPAGVTACVPLIIRCVPQVPGAEGRPRAAAGRPVDEEVSSDSETEM